MMTSFIYLWRGILAAGDDWPVVVHNLVKVRVVWRRMTRIISRERARPRVSGFFFKSAVRSMLFFGADTWVVTPHMGRVLGGFQYQVAQQLTGRIMWRKSDRKWE